MKQPEDAVTLGLPLPEPARRAVPTVPIMPVGDWRAALDAAVAACPTGKKGVAELLGVSRPLVSRVMNGDLPASAAFKERVATHLMQVDCPHLQRPLPPQDCHRYAQRTYAQVNQFEVEHWRACRSCPNNRTRLAPAAAAAAPAPMPMSIQKPAPNHAQHAQEAAQ